MKLAHAALRVSKTAVAALALVCVFVAALAAALLLHLGTAPARRIVARELPVLLAGAFPGRLEIHGLGGLSIYGLGGVDVDLVHPDGEIVARLRGVQATLDPIRAVKAFIGGGPIEIPISSVGVENLDLDITTHRGNLRIADVFVDAAAPAAPDDPNARELGLHIRDIVVRHGWVHGRIEAEGPVIDADLDELRASFALDDTTLRVGLARVDVVTRQAPRHADLRGRVSAAFDMNDEPSGDRPAQSAFFFLHGTVARSPVSAIGFLRGDAIHAWGWLAEVTPEQIRAAAPEAPPIAAPIDLTAVVDGTFDRLGARVLAAADKTRLDVKLDASFTPSLVASAKLVATDLDAALVGGPSSAVSLDADATVAIPEGGEPQGKASLATRAGVVAGVPVPPVVGEGTFARGAAHATLDVREPGMRAALVADLKPGPRGAIVDARLDVPDADLAALKRRGFEASGHAHVSAIAHVDLGRETVAGSVKVAASNLSAAKAAPGVSVGSLRLDARAEGPFVNPDVSGRALARAVVAEERDIRWASLSVDGPAMSPTVVAEVSSLDVPHVRARARVDVRGGPALEDVQVDAERGTTRAKLTARRVVIGAGIPTLREVRLDGLGEPMTVSVTPDSGRAARIVASAPRISIPAVSELAGVDLGVHRGRFSIDADVLIAPEQLDGKVALHVQDVDLRRADIRLDDIDCSVDAEIRGREVQFAIDSETKTIGGLHVRNTRTIELAGPPTDVASWRDAVGAVHIEGDLRLASLARLVPSGQLPVQDVEGRVVLRGAIAREARGEAPSTDIAIETHELAVIGKPTAVTVRGIDLAVRAVATPEPQRVELSVKARDVHGDLVAISASSSELAYGRIVAGERVDLASLEDTTLSARVTIPSRRIADLPPTLGIPQVKGNIVLDATFEGTLKQPKVAVDGALAQLAIEGSPLEKPFVVKVVADYDGAKANAHVALDQDGTRLLKATGHGSVAMHDVLAPPKGRPMPWTASADVRLGPLPLDVLEAVLPTKIDGVARGHIKLTDLHRNASLDADVNVDGLVLGGISHREAFVKVTAEDGKLVGKLRMAQPDGAIDVDAAVGIAWGDRIVPELRASEAFDVGVRAKRFRLRAAEPFLSSVLNRLDGRLDGEVLLSKEALTEAAKGRGVKGKLALSRGSVEIAAGGGPLDDVRATVRVDEQGMVRLDDVFLRGATGEMRAVGVASFDAAGFHAARVNVVIPQKKPMPLLISGEHLADVSTNVKVSADMVDRGRELRVGVDVARLEVSLPDSLPDGVQKLDDIEHVRVGTVRRGRFIPLAVDAPDPAATPADAMFRTRVNIALRDGRIVKGDMLSTYLRGNPSLLIDGDKAVMSGAIKLKGGRVDIKGRRFEIEGGTITFTGDPANPDVLLTAKWKAPDDTMIYADFVGPLTTGKVNLRSEPPRSREEILALVIFGRAEGYSSGGQEADKGTQAVGMAGGFATEGLNKVLDDVTSVEIRTRVDTSSSANPRPELEVQISQEVAARIAYVLGEIAPGQSADKTYATIDWSFRPEWSLETTVGDEASTTFDMIWERRY